MRSVTSFGPSNSTAYISGPHFDERVEELYEGRVRVLPHKYTEGRYLVVPAEADTLRRLVFELRPVDLSERGLVDAVRRDAGRASSPDRS